MSIPRKYIDLITEKTYYGLMKTATISQFKAHISENLRDVQAGEHVIIMDRNTAVAEVSPIRIPSPSETKARKIFSVLTPPVIRLKTDAADYLEQERGSM